MPSPVTSIPRLILAFAAVWLMLPHQPDMGLGKPNAIRQFVTQAPANPCPGQSACDGTVFRAMLDSVANMEDFRSGLISAVDRVRADMDAHRPRGASRTGSRPGA